MNNGFWQLFRFLGLACVIGSWGCSSANAPADARTGDVSIVDQTDATTVSDVGALDLADATNEPASPNLSQQELTAVVTTLASDEFDGRKPGTVGWEKAQAYLQERMAACGLKPAGTDGYKQAVTTGIGINLLGRIDGTDPGLKERVVIVSAHYDHIGDCGGKICNGALDNAAGVTAVLAVGCALVATPPARSVIIALWDTEEPPTFLTPKMGSEFYASNPTVPLTQIDVVLVLDLIGGNFWGSYKGHFLMGAEFSPEVASAVDATAPPAGLLPYRIGLHLVEEQVVGGHQPWSDYDAFRNKNVPFLFISDGQNKVYHKSDDEVGNLDLTKLAAEATFLHSLVVKLANAAKSPTFVPDGTDYPTEVASILAMSNAVSAPGGLVESLGLSAQTQANLQKDLANVEAVKKTLDDGKTLGASDVTTLRKAVQRVMCLAGSGYSEALCNLL